MRGKDNKGTYDNSITRITPAYAGKREVYMSANFRRQDHPRLCGEKLRHNANV